MKAFKVKLTFNLADWVTWIALHDMMGLIQSDEISDREGLLPPTRHREFYQQPLDLNCVSSLRSTMQILNLNNSINLWANSSINFSLSYPSIRGKHVIYSYIWLSGITEMQSFSFGQWDTFKEIVLTFTHSWLMIACYDRIWMVTERSYGRCAPLSLHRVWTLRGWVL